MKHATGKSNLSIVQDYLNGERPFTQTGWTPDMIKRAEGECWKEADGTTWMYKDGQKKPVGRISALVASSCKQECKDCKMNVRLFGKPLDTKMYYKTGRCFNCQILFEDGLKRKGLFEKYEKYKIFQNQKSYCLDIKSKLEESIKYLEGKDNVLEYMNDDGTSEKWTDTMRENLLTSAKKDYAECLTTLNDIEDRLKENYYGE